MSHDGLPKKLSFHGNGGSYPPHGVITATDHGPAVVVTTWIMFSLMGLSVLARFGIRRNFSADNILIFAATVLAIFQSVSVHLAVNHGLGRHRAKLSDAKYDIYGKATYTGQILKISVVCLAKLSLILVFSRLTPAKRVRQLLWLFMTFILFWATAAIIALSLQCQLPHPWDLTPNRCFNQGVLHYTNGLVDIVTDVIIIVLPITIVWNVQIKRKEQWTIRLVFATRISVCIASALELISLKNYLRSSDQTWFHVDLSIWGQVMMNLSIITACIPLTKPFLNMLQFSLIDSSVQPFSASTYQLHSKGRGGWTRES